MTLQQLLVKDLHDLYQAESAHTHALPRLMQAAATPELRAVLEEHLGETEQQVQRLSQVLTMLDETPGGAGEVPLGVRGLTEEAERKMKEEIDPEMRDLCLIAAAQKMEHYEIACYGTARALANTIGRDEEARLLQTSLAEEERADQKLTQVALPLLKRVGQHEPNLV